MIDPLSLPGPDDSWEGWLRERTDAQLDLARTLVDRLKDGTARDSRAVLELWNDADIALDNASSAAHLLSQVHPDPAVRALAEDYAQQVSTIDTDRSLDRGVFEVVSATEPTGDEQADRLRERILRDFRRSGVDQPDDVRARLREIAERLVVLEQDFGRAIREDVRTVRVRPEQLDGLPQDFIDAHPAGDDGLVVLTTEYPDVVPFRTFATDAAARLELFSAFLNRAHPANEPVLTEMLELRHERATLLGYPNWPDFDAEVKMIASGDAIIEFIDRITAAADERAHRELDILRERQRRDHPDATTLTRADSVYYEELVRREQYDVDAQQVRRYFEFTRVRDGLLGTTARLFRIEYRRRDDAASWHEDVTVYDVLADGEPAGRIYLDLHPREGKFKHAAQFVLVPGVAGRQLPEGALVCNLPRQLMEHTDVVTLFHEFGHLVHHVLAGRQQWERFSGVSTEWDFVEAPSQMLEEWAWDADVLRSFAEDEHGPIPRDLVERMRRADEFGKGLFLRTQMYYAALSYLLHRDRPRDLAQYASDTQRRYEVFDPIEDTHFYASFGHLAGYTSGYYTYLWSLVIAKDLFSAFDRGDLLAPEVARRYRDEILAPGGSRDAADLVTAFLGRAYSFDAFGRWLDGT